MRAFIFSVWAHVGEKSENTLEALKSLAAKQYSVAEQGGRYVISASSQGKSFTWELPPGETPASFTETAYDAWRMLKIGGASGGQMTDAELEAYVVDAGGQYTDTVIATFTQRSFDGR
jgi:hypothetical protein